MAKSIINLDALIVREDFQVIKSSNSTSAGPQLTATLRATDLVQGSFLLAALRKPDFQRETSGWTPEKVCALVGSFVSGDLIPSIILWKANDFVFVIDGAHRLSALIGWANDDYGDGVFSKEFYRDSNITNEQRKAAQKARELVNSKIGSYADLERAVRSRATNDPLFKIGQSIATLTLQIQWVQGDIDKAEQSFLTINQSSTPIEPAELRLIKSRKKPHAIAARAILRSGSANTYWSPFQTDNQTKIKELGTRTYRLLFHPEIQEPIRTLDLPFGGKGYSAEALPLVTSMIELAMGNDLVSASRRSGKNEPDPATADPDDENGGATVDLLARVAKLLSRLSGNDSGSLGVHPVVYFYGLNGRYQPTAFLAGLRFFKELIDQDQLKKFTQVRKRFEEFLIRYKNFQNQTVRKFGSGPRGYRSLLALWRVIYEHMLQGATDDKILEALGASSSFDYLQPGESVEFASADRTFSKEAKVAVFIRTALEAAVRCPICNGLLDAKAMSYDHIDRVRDGGSSTSANAQLTHPYCNSAIKN